MSNGMSFASRERPAWRLSDEQFAKIEQLLPTDTRGKERISSLGARSPDEISSSLSVIIP